MFAYARDPLFQSLRLINLFHHSGDGVFLCSGTNFLNGGGSSFTAEAIAA
jgi:hypothetical protein